MIKNTPRFNQKFYFDTLAKATYRASDRDISIFDAFSGIHYLIEYKVKNDDEKNTLEAFKNSNQFKQHYEYYANLDKDNKTIVIFATHTVPVDKEIRAEDLTVCGIYTRESGWVETDNIKVSLSDFLFNMTINNSEDYWTIKVNSKHSGKTYFCRTHPLQVGDDSSWISPILDASCLFKSKDSCEKYIQEREKCGFNKGNIYTIHNKQGEKYGEHTCN